MRILFVAMAHSVHSARWIGQLSDQGWDLHLFAAGPEEYHVIHRDFHDLTVHDAFRDDRVDPAAHVRQTALIPRRKQLLTSIARRFAHRRLSMAYRLPKLIRRLRPDLIHSLETQHAGYTVLEARAKVGDLPIWIHSTWGSDLYYWGRHGHADNVRRVMETIDYLIPDCQRDVQLAREYGFRREILGVFPGPGGFDLERMRRLHAPRLPSARRVIALKGQHDDNWVYRALVGIQALMQSSAHLGGYEIVVYYSTPNVRHVVDFVRRISPLRISVMGESSHEEILRLFGRSRIAIGLSTSDGTPSAMLEAMVMGAFPIQSDTQSTGEWITDGQNGALVPPEDPGAVSAAIIRAVQDDALIDRAAELNERLASKRIDERIIKPQVLAAYQLAFESKNRVANSLPAHPATNPGAERSAAPDWAR